MKLEDKNVLAVATSEVLNHHGWWKQHMKGRKEGSDKLFAVTKLGDQMAAVRDLIIEMDHQETMLLFNVLVDEGVSFQWDEGGLVLSKDGWDWESSEGLNPREALCEGIVAYSRSKPKRGRKPKGEEE